MSFNYTCHIFLETITERASSFLLWHEKSSEVVLLLQSGKKISKNTDSKTFLVRSRELQLQGMLPPWHQESQEDKESQLRSTHLAPQLRQPQTGRNSYVTGQFDKLLEAECGLAGTWATHGWHGLRGYPHFCGFHFQEPHQVPMVEPRQRPCVSDSGRGKVTVSENTQNILHKKDLPFQGKRLYQSLISPRRKGNYPLPAPSRILSHLSEGVEGRAKNPCEVHTGPLKTEIQWRL